MKHLRISIVLILSLICVFAAPAYARDAKSILNSYIYGLPPAKRIRCGVGLNRRRETAGEREAKIRDAKKVQKLVAEIISLGPTAMPDVVNGLEHKDRRVRKLAQRALIAAGEMGVPALVAKAQTVEKSAEYNFKYEATQVVKLYPLKARMKAIKLLLNTKGPAKPLCWSIAAYGIPKSARRYRKQETEGAVFAKYALWFANGLSSSSENLRLTSLRMLEIAVPSIKSKAVLQKVENSLYLAVNAPENQKFKKSLEHLMRNVSRLRKAKP